MEKKPRRTRQEWGDIIFKKGSYVAIAISLVFTVPVVVYIIFLLFQTHGARAFIILFFIGLIVSYIAYSIKVLS